MLPRQLHQPSEHRPRPRRLALFPELFQQRPHLLVLAVHRLQRRPHRRRRLFQPPEQKLILFHGVRLQHGFQSRGALLQPAQAHPRHPPLLMPDQRQDAAVLAQQQIDQIRACLRRRPVHAPLTNSILPDSGPIHQESFARPPRPF